MIVLMAFSHARAAEREMRLRLKDGSVSVGQVVISRELDRLGWMIAGLENPVNFDLRVIRSASTMFDDREQVDNPPGTKFFQLFGGSLIVGKLLELGDQFAIIETQTFGTIKVERSLISSLTDAGYAGDVIYSGPKDDATWNILSKEDDWEFHAGSLVASKQDASILGNVGLPAKAQINLVLSWRGVADFVFSLGTPDVKSMSGGQIPAAARLEVWDKQLALVREVPGNADIALISDLTGADSRVDLTLYIDQEAGTVTACDAHGRPLETITAVASNKTTYGSVHLMNHGPALTLERFEIREWDGRTSTANAMAGLNVIDDEGRVFEGAISGFASEQNSVELELAGKSDRLTLPLASIRRADFMPPKALPEEKIDDGTVAGDGEDRLQVEVIFADRTRLWGQWLPADGTHLQLASSGVVPADRADGPLRFSAQDLSGIIGSSNRYVIERGEHKYGTLKLGNSELAGYLLETSPTQSLTALYWHPYGSSNASQILPAASGAIVYRNSLPRVTKTERSVRLDQEAVQPIVQAFQDGTALSKSAAEKNGDARLATQARELTFRSGDAIDGIVNSIDEQGMHFASRQTTNTFAKHAQIQSVWLNELRNSADLSSQKLKRFMTVPRAMKDDPPTHVLIAVTGDHLRCRLVSLDSNSLTVEVGPEVSKIPRARIAQIIWLHDRDWEDQEPLADEQSGAPQSEFPFQVHGTYGLDHGLTFQPKSMQDGILSGSSQLLGDCSFDINQVSRLLFGRNIALRIREYRKDPWTLSLAQYPRVYLDAEGDGESSVGRMQSPLVGTAAPEISLKDLAGQSFRLSKSRGRIVVLDFWASWCGPCMQTMPLVEKAVAETGEGNVDLIAVNIQEAPGRAQAAVDRLGIGATVALDTDGEVASIYGASAIPQTVIIDRSGIVTHVFVGGGSRFLAEFKAALSAVMDN